MILEKVDNGFDVIVYLETKEDREKFLHEVKNVPIPNGGDMCRMQDPTDWAYCDPEYKTWYIKRMLDDGWSLIGESSGFIFSRPKK